MIGTRNTFIISWVLLTIIHDAMQTPLKPLQSLVDGQDDDEDGSLSSEDFKNGLSENLDQDKPEIDEDGDADLFEGDIEGEKAELRMLAENREVVGHAGKKWPKVNGVVTVPYTIPSSISKQSKSELAKVITEYETKTCIRLVPRSKEKNYVHIDSTPSGHRCSSPLGMSGGKQTIKFGEACTWGNLAHEFMHSLGFFHEHTRSDRDKYMTVNWDNIKKYEKETGRTWKHNFLKCTDRGCNDLNVGYDYESIMHYGQNMGRYPVLIPKSSGVYIGQRNHLSDKDIIGLNEHYCSGPDAKKCSDTRNTGDCGNFLHVCKKAEYAWFAAECEKSCGICKA